MDIVFLQGLKAQCTIGVWEWEKQITQPIEIDLEVSADIAAAAATDRLEDTLDYKAVARTVLEFAEQSRLALIETLAEEIANIILQEFKASWVRVRINKGGAVKNCRNVGIEIERSSRADE
jgi:dihydroneopterin aldolase